MKRLRRNPRTQPSLPARGAWIEIRGVWEGKRIFSRSPHGERGLKYRGMIAEKQHKASLPARGAWIEMEMAKYAGARCHSRSPHGERGLKWFILRQYEGCLASLPARGAWIEISSFRQYVHGRCVAPRTGSVD